MPLFAFDENGIIISALSANKTSNYYCLNDECRSPLVLKQGNKRTHHFSHKGDCNHGGINESQEHFDTKCRIYNQIKERKCSFEMNMVCERCGIKTVMEFDCDKDTMTDVFMEKTIRTQDKVEKPDISIFNGNEPVFFIEVVKTHCHSERTKPWIEICAESDFQLMDKYKISKYYCCERCKNPVYQHPLEYEMGDNYICERTKKEDKKMRDAISFILERDVVNSVPEKSKEISTSNNKDDIEDDVKSEILGINYIIPYGKYKGEVFSDVICDTNYFTWVLNCSSNLIHHPEFKSLIEALLKYS